MADRPPAPNRPLQRLRDTVRARAQADLLLRRLLSDRALLEERAGEHDPMKCLTGASALDRAVIATEDMIHHMDELLNDLHTELTAGGAPAGVPPSNGRAAPRSRPLVRPVRP